MADASPTRADHEKHAQEGGYQARVIYADTSEGYLFQIEICDECHFVTAICEHSHMEWITPKALICQACGIDGT